MDVVYPHCAGLDVHKKTVVACRITPGPKGQPQKEIRTFATMTGELLALSDWLAAGGVTHVAMESTGVYWKPLYNLLEGSFTLLLVNAQHIKNNTPLSHYSGGAAVPDYSLGYLHHLFKINDSLFLRLATMHNLRFMAQLCTRLREGADG